MLKRIHHVMNKFHNRVSIFIYCCRIEARGAGGKHRLMKAASLRQPFSPRRFPLNKPTITPEYPLSLSFQIIISWFIRQSLGPLTMDGARPSRPDRPYQRTYKACIPCRARKAKCDLGTGPDGLPIGPPCARCRREMRECIFPEKRAWERSRKRGKLVTPRCACVGVPLANL